MFLPLFYPIVVRSAPEMRIEQAIETAQLLWKITKYQAQSIVYAYAFINEREVMNLWCSTKENDLMKTNVDEIIKLSKTVSNTKIEE